MALSDIIIPSREVVINQSHLKQPNARIDVFGLTTMDYSYLFNRYKTILDDLFFRKKEDGQAKVMAFVSSLTDQEISRLIVSQFPEFMAAAISCGCKGRLAEDYVLAMPFPIQAELFFTVLELTFPDGVKKNLPLIRDMLSIQLLR